MKRAWKTGEKRMLVFTGAICLSLFGLGVLYEWNNRVPDLKIPTLRRLEREACFGRMKPQSVGKDTTSGHWEIAGAILTSPFAVFERFPAELVENIERGAKTQFLGNLVASGTQILEILGEQSVSSGRPILYTSADSVLQIAAHETHFGLEKLLEICEIARAEADKWNIGRVIARPFEGEIGHWHRTSNRRDFSILPPRTILDALRENGVETTGIGKISDIFAARGIARSIPTKSNAQGMETIETQWKSGRQGLFFANLVDFDTLFGHRRDVLGYARALEEFDAWLAGFLPQIRPDDLVIFTADHGNDPTFRGTDHTREWVPIWMIHPSKRENLGTRETFADIAATLGDFFDVKWETGTGF